MKVKDEISFEEYLTFYPEVELPIVLSEDSIRQISSINKALPPVALANFLLPFEKEEDEFVEFIPCLSFTISERVTAIIFWRGSLLSYEYYLVTYDQLGNRMSSKVIAGIISNGEDIRRSVATINEDFSIHIISGGENTTNGEASNSSSFYMEIMSDGEIISFKEENGQWQQEEKVK